MVDFPFYMDDAENTRVDDVNDLGRMLAGKGVPWRVADSISDTVLEANGAEEAELNRSPLDCDEVYQLEETYQSAANEFCNFVEEVAAKLQSGKKGKGFTKSDLAQELLDACKRFYYDSEVY